MKARFLTITHWATMSPAKKSAVVYMFGSYIQYAIGFLVTPVFARLLTTAEFGLVSTYNSWQEMLRPVATLSLYAGFFNVGMVDYEHDRDAFTTSLLGLSFVSGIATGSAFVAVGLLLPGAIGLPQSLLLLLFLHFLTFSPTRYWMARERFEYRYKKLFGLTMSMALLAPAGGLLFVCLSRGNLGVAKLFGTNAIHILLGVAFVGVLLGKSRKMFDADRWKVALLFSLPLIPHYLAMHVLSASDRVMINNISGRAPAGLYGMAYTVAMVVTTAWTAINGSLTPYAYKKIKERDFPPLARVGTLCIVAFSVICLLACVVAPEAIRLLGGEKYRESVRLMPPLFAAVVFMEMYNLFSLIEFYNKKTVSIMVATVAAAMLNVGLNYVFIKRMGYQAAAYTTLVCYAGYCLFHYANMRRIEKERIYSPRLLLGFSAAYVVLCFACLFLYPHPVLRYGLFAAAVVAVAAKRKQLIRFYGSLQT